MPEAGRVMYRVDTTIDEPITTSILCGACAHIEVVKGKKPQTYTCVSCQKFLWLDEEE
jgi:transposase